MSDKTDSPAVRGGSVSTKPLRAIISVPAYNEEATIVDVLRALPSTVPGVSEAVRLVVDDGSTDRTADLAEREGVSVIRHPRNLGVGKAFRTAVNRALESGADILLTVDGDGQFDPRQIANLAAPIIAGRADVVTGGRFSGAGRPPGMPRVKYWGNLWVAWLVRLFSGAELADVSCGFRAYSREALLQLNLFASFTYTQETILDLAFKEARIEEVPVDVKYFSGRRSRVAGSIFRYAINSAKIIARTVRDFRPFQFFGTIGLAVFLVGLTLDLWLAAHYVRTGNFSPYKVVGFVGGALNITGILLAGVGLLADMLTHIRINQERILYFHKKRTFEGREHDEDSA